MPMGPELADQREPDTYGLQDLAFMRLADDGCPLFPDDRDESCIMPHDGDSSLPV